MGRRREQNRSDPTKACEAPAVSGVHRVRVPRKIRNISSECREVAEADRVHVTTSVSKLSEGARVDHVLQLRVHGNESRRVGVGGTTQREVCQIGCTLRLCWWVRAHVAKMAFLVALATLPRQSRAGVLGVGCQAASRTLAVRSAGRCG